MPELNIGTDPEAGCVVKTSGEWHSLVRVFTDPNKNGAIGLDGGRHSASLEFRPGIQKSSEVLVHKLAHLVTLVHEYYHPPFAAYRCGAWVDPEPLGGHVHFSWGDDLPVTKLMVGNLLTGLNKAHYRLTQEWFPAAQIGTRQRYAQQHDRDYAMLGMFRARAHRKGTVEDVLAMQHIEYRYPPSWLLTPEMTYTYLASAEVVARLALLDRYDGPWTKIISGMFDGDGYEPQPGMPNVRTAYKAAGRHLKWEQDFTENWL